MAKKKITIAEVFYISSHKDTKSPEEIARDLGLSVLTVQKLVEQANNGEQLNMAAKPKTMTQIAFEQNKRPGSVAEKYGVTIMSPTASELGDDKNLIKKGSKGRDDCIFRPKD